MSKSQKRDVTPFLLALVALGLALIPGGPYVYYPIAGVLLQTCAGLGCW